MLKMKSISREKTVRAALLLTLMFNFSACDLPQMPSQKEVEKKSDEVIKKTGPKINEAAGIGVKGAELDPLAISNDVWLGNQAVRMHTGKPLPSKFENSKGFTLVSAAPVDLRTVAAQINSATGIRTSLGDLTLDSGHEKITSTSTTATPTSSSTTSISGTTNEPILPSLVQTTTDSINVSYSGPLSKFLDQVAEQLDVSWRYDGESIYFYRYESRTYTIEALAGKSSVSDSFSPSSGGGGGGGGSSSSSSDVTQKNDLSSDSDAWKDIEAALKGILGSDGSEVMVPSSGTVLVTARPTKLDQIAKYLAEENNRMTRQVAIDIVVYNVDVTNEDNYGIDLSNAFKFSAGSRPATSIGPTTTTTTVSNGVTTVASTQTSVTGISTELGQTSVGVTGPASVIATNGAETAGSLAIGFLSSHWNASAVAKALSTLGHTVEVTRAPIVTLNNRSASRKISTDQTYIATQSATAATATSAATQSITPGVATTGITLQVLPRLTTDDRILVQYSIMISALNGTIQSTCANQGSSPTTGGSSCIGTPNTTNKVFVQQALLQNGSTLVLAGFDDESNNDKLEGLGSPYNWLMGGTDAKKDHEHLVITMTPREITPGRGNS